MVDLDGPEVTGGCIVQLFLLRSAELLLVFTLVFPGSAGQAEPDRYIQFVDITVIELKRREDASHRNKK
jgi:hypothetical protein